MLGGFCKAQTRKMGPTASSCICSKHFMHDTFDRILNLPGIEKPYRPVLKRDGIGITSFPTVYAAEEANELSGRAARAIKRKVGLIVMLSFDV